MSPPETEKHSAIVVGGFGGLSTTCYLTDAGLDVTLLEKNDTLGGLGSSFPADGFRFDTGRHGI